MGIFSLFGKKERPPVPADAASAVRKKAELRTQDNPSADDARREKQADDQRQAARATALKIDAIESEMSSEFVRPGARPATAAAHPDESSLAATGAAMPPALSASSNFMLSDTIFDSLMGDAAAEDMPLFEEAAILFANRQTDMAEQVLKDAVEGNTTAGNGITAWAMLFDLYQVSGDQAAFENLSIAYAKHFETSPPAWTPLAVDDTHTIVPRAAAMPSVALTGKLDAAIGMSLDKARLLADSHPAVRLELNRISAVDAEGCSLLLQALNQLQKSGTDLILLGAPELVEKIRTIIEVGRRDDTEAPWLLLLELLGLQNLESAFEETSIEYCITFEVSPPAFVPPKNRVATVMEMPDPAKADSDCFIMPALIEGRTDALVAELGAYAALHNPARIDCAALARVDVNAATQLMAGLAPFTGDGQVIEFIHVNHLVATLFSVVGLNDIIRIHTRKI
ncbi:MAG: hypothetical protein H7234_02060 [Herminiimonas sp.]|nr:hypothetical protein [Herminiimonas sp.]